MKKLAVVIIIIQTIIILALLVYAMAQRTIAEKERVEASYVAEMAEEQATLARAEAEINAERVRMTQIMLDSCRAK